MEEYRTLDQYSDIADFRRVIHPDSPSSVKSMPVFTVAKEVVTARIGNKSELSTILCPMSLPLWHNQRGIYNVGTFP
jgi:hypothetical protein